MPNILLLRMQYIAPELREILREILKDETNFEFVL